MKKKTVLFGTRNTNRQENKRGRQNVPAVERKRGIEMLVRMNVVELKKDITVGLETDT